MDKKRIKPTVRASEKYTGGYYINKKFVFACNWEISKDRFTKDEQLEFEKYIMKSKLNKIQTHIQQQRNLAFEKSGKSALK